MCCTVPDLNGGLDVLQVTEEVKVSEVPEKSGMFLELTESLEVQVFLEGFGGCEGSEGDGSGGDGFGGNGVMVSRISDGCRGFRRLRFQFRGSFFERFRGGLGQAGTPAQMGFRRVLEAVWKVGTGLPGMPPCSWACHLSLLER